MSLGLSANYSSAEQPAGTLQHSPARHLQMFLEARYCCDKPLNLPVELTCATFRLNSLSVKNELFCLLRVTWYFFASIRISTGNYCVFDYFHGLKLAK